MTTQRRHRRQATSPEIFEQIQRLTVLKWTPVEIRLKLNADEKFAADHIPSLRTVQRIARAITPEDPSGPWSLAEASSDEASLVLRVLRETIDWQGTGLTKGEAEWVVKIQEAAPTIDPTQAYLLARVYMARVAQGEPTDDLDACLAFAPWVNQEQQDAWNQAVESGRVVRRGLILLTEEDLQRFRATLEDAASERNDLLKFIADSQYEPKQNVVTEEGAPPNDEAS